MGRPWSPCRVGDVFCSWCASFVLRFKPHAVPSEGTRWPLSLDRGQALLEDTAHCVESALAIGGHLSREVLRGATTSRRSTLSSGSAHGRLSCLDHQTLLRVLLRANENEGCCAPTARSAWLCTVYGSPTCRASLMGCLALRRFRWSLICNRIARVRIRVSLDMTALTYVRRIGSELC